VIQLSKLKEAVFLKENVLVKEYKEQTMEQSYEHLKTIKSK
jgi:hypothetical protein